VSGVPLALALIVGATAPGWRIGWRVFGARHAAGWVAGALLGYWLAAMAIWTAAVLGHASRRGLLAAWLATLAISWLAAGRRSSPLVALDRWTRKDALALGAALLVALAIAIPPLARVGASDATGTRYYRAYFTADFLWHRALTAEVARFELPPRNPYLADRTIHYYWTYFLVPAAIASRGPAAAGGVEPSLKAAALFTAVALTSVIFLLARAAVPRAAAAAVATTLGITAASAEGWYAVWRLSSDGVPLSYLRELNVDAMANWYLHGLRIDNLPRCFWYVPQHSMGYALGTIGLLVLSGAGSAAPTAAIAIAALALAAAVTVNPLVGSIFALGYGGAVLIDVLRARGSARRLIWHAAAAIPVAAAVGWCVANQMVEGAGGALRFGLYRPAAHAPVAALLLSLGPALVPAAAGLWAWRGLDFRRVLPSAVMLVLGLGLMYYVSLDVDESWVGFRAGQILLVTIPALAARFFSALLDAPRRRAAAWVCAALILAAGLPTTVIDAYNAADISNRNRSAGGFVWTIAITPAQQEAFRWIRRATPPDAAVQMEPVIRGRETWTLIPSFAERRMAAGLPISLLNIPDYTKRSEMVRALYATDDPAAAHATARRLQIDYLYMDDIERAAYPAGTEKFARRPDLFLPVFHSGDVAVFAVAR
jgi:hypothetical protein